jgi:hypothetical protein
MKKIKGKQERTPEEGKRLANIQVALVFFCSRSFVSLSREREKRVMGLKCF